MVLDGLVVSWRGTRSAKDGSVVPARSVRARGGDARSGRVCPPQQARTLALEFDVVRRPNPPLEVGRRWYAKHGWKCVEVWRQDANRGHNRIGYVAQVEVGP